MENKYKVNLTSRNKNVFFWIILLRIATSCIRMQLKGLWWFRWNETCYWARRNCDLKHWRKLIKFLGGLQKHIEFALLIENEHKTKPIFNLWFSRCLLILQITYEKLHVEPISKLTRSYDTDHIQNKASKLGIYARFDCTCKPLKGWSCLVL